MHKKRAQNTVLSGAVKSVFTPAEMEAADAATINAGVTGWKLMLAAGKAVAQTAIDQLKKGDRICVLAGPGNNGGDGYVAAQELLERGLSVEMFALGNPAKLTGDAALARDYWTGPINSLDPASLKVAEFDLAIDALFGAGLSRDLDGAAKDVLMEASNAEASILAVDVPSGLCGESGLPRGFAPHCDLTITFHAKKRGHLLQLGRDLCGDIRVVDIGLLPDAKDFPTITVFENTPALWLPLIVSNSSDTHKYRRGHVGVVTGGATATGAGRLAADAASFGGVGLTTLLSPSSAALVNAAHATGTMVKSFGKDRTIGEFIIDHKISTLVAGPGMGTEKAAAETLDVLVGLGREAADVGHRNFVLDADALTIMNRNPESWFDDLPKNTVLTPHDGEFARLFPDLASLPKVERTREAANRAGAVVVLKGNDTVIAGSDGRVAINANAPPWLAKAGAGDVLAGLIAAAMAQGITPFEAACAGVWYHGQTATEIGPGLQVEALAAQAGHRLAQDFWSDLRIFPSVS